MFEIAVRSVRRFYFLFPLQNEMSNECNKIINIRYISFTVVSLPNVIKKRTREKENPSVLFFFGARPALPSCCAKSNWTFAELLLFSVIAINRRKNRRKLLLHNLTSAPHNTGQLHSGLIFISSPLASAQNKKVAEKTKRNGRKKIGRN